ncbi:MAG: hypothetical protein ACLGI3_08420 [Actinomycetes bacterium]
MLIDCDTCTARGTGCADCVVTVLLGAPPGWQGDDPVVVPMPARARPPRGAEPLVAAPDGPDARRTLTAEDVVLPPPGVVVEFDEVERRAVRALADVGLVPPLRHRSAPDDGPGADRRTG